MGTGLPGGHALGGAGQHFDKSRCSCVDFSLFCSSAKSFMIMKVIFHVRITSYTTKKVRIGETHRSLLNAPRQVKVGLYHPKIQEQVF